MQCLSTQLTQASAQLLSMFGLNVSLLESSTSPHLCSAEELTVLLSFAGGMRGHVAIAMTEYQGKYLASAMMGGFELAGIDEMAQSAISEFANMLVGTAINGISHSAAIHLSPPTLVLGKDVLLIASRVESTKLVFSMNDSTFTIMFSVE